MAVHLERPLPREPFPGKRHRRRVLALGALLAFGGFGLLAPAHAQDGSLSAGTSAFTAGKYDATVRMMTGVLQGDKVDPSEAAKALYYRGLAYQKLKQHTRAIADLGAAMWLGLPASERTAALVNRSLAYRAAGLSSQADTELAAARKGDRGGDVDRIIASNGGSGTADTASISGFATEVRTEGGRTTTIASAEPAAAPPRNAEAAKPELLDHHAAVGSGSERTAKRRQSPVPLVGLGQRLFQRTRACSGTGPAAGTKRRRGILGLDDADPSRRRRPRNTCGDGKSHRAGALWRWWQLSPATQPNALGGRSERAVENRRQAERAARQPSAAHRKDRHGQSRHLLSPPDRTLPGQGGKP